MSSTELCKLIYDIGYRPSDRKLVPDSLEWLFLQNDASKGFLQWFCHTVSAKNVLSDAELLEYAELERSKTILSGAELEEAIQDIEAWKTCQEEEALEQEIAKLEKELMPLKKEVHLLARRHNRLESHLAAQKKKNQHYESLYTSRQHCTSKTLLPRLEHRSTQLDQVTSRIEACTVQLVNFFASTISSAGSATQHSSFLSTSSWIEFYRQEERYTKQVKLYMRLLMPNTGNDSLSGSQFSDASSLDSSTGGNGSELENNRYYWMRVPDPKSIRFRGVDASTHARQSTELSRLRDLFAPSESAKAHAEMELARRNAEIETLKLQVIDGHQQYNSIDEMGYKQKTRELSKRHQRIRNLLARNVEQVLPELFLELAKLQSTPILWADYNLKLSRLHLQRVKIDLVLSSLLKTRAKTMILPTLLNEEKRQHIELHTLLNAVSADLGRLNADWTRRNEVLHHRSLQPHIPQELQHFKLLSQLVDAGAQFSPARLAKVISALGEEKRKTNAPYCLALHEINGLETIKRHVKRVRTLLYRGSVGQRPLQTSPELTKMCRKMDECSSSLASSLESIMKEFTQHSKSIAESSKESQFERALWKYFFTGRSKNIKAAFEDLQSKIKTQRVVKA